MKKLLALLLVLTLVFSVTLSLTACGDSENTECTAHVDEDGNGKCDKCEKDMSKNPENPENSEIPADKLGETISAAVIAQLNSAASVKFELETLAIVSQSVAGAAEGASDSTYMDSAVKVTAVASKTENGVNAKLDVSMKTKESKDGEYGEAEEFTYLYLIDNVAYVYDVEADAYFAEKIDVGDTEEITTMLEALFEGIDPIADEDIAALKKSLGDLFVKTFTVEGKKATLAVDAKPTFDALLDYIKNLDPNTKTVEALINDILALVDEELKIDALLTEVKRVAGLTANEAVAEIDAWLTENHETTLQGIYDTIVGNEDFIKLYKNFMKMQGMEDENAITAAIDEMKAIKIADLLKTEIAEGTEIGNVELIIILSEMFMSSGPDDEVPVPYTEASAADAMIEEIFGMIEPMLDLTITEANTQFYPMMQIVPMIKTYAAGVAVNAYNEKIIVNFAEGYNISTIEGENNMDIEINAPAGPGVTMNMASIIKTTFKVYDLSATAVEIKLPENIKVIEGGVPSEPEELASILAKEGYAVESVIDPDVVAALGYAGLVAQVSATKISLTNIGDYEMMNAFYFESEAAAELAYEALEAALNVQLNAVGCELVISDNVVYACTDGVLEAINK